MFPEGAMSWRTAQIWGKVIHWPVADLRPALGCGWRVNGERTLMGLFSFAKGRVD